MKETYFMNLVETVPVNCTHCPCMGKHQYTSRDYMFYCEVAILDGGTKRRIKHSESYDIPEWCPIAKKSVINVTSSEWQIYANIGFLSDMSGSVLLDKLNLNNKKRSNEYDY